MGNRIVGFDETQTRLDLVRNVQINEQGVAECRSLDGAVIMRLAGVVADVRLGRYEHVPFTDGGFSLLNMDAEATEPLAVGFYFGIADSGTVDPEKIIGTALRKSGDGVPLIVNTDGTEIPISLRTDTRRHHGELNLIRKLDLEAKAGLPREMSRLLLERAVVNTDTGAVDISVPLFVNPGNGHTNHFQFRGYDTSTFDPETATQGLSFLPGVNMVGAFEVQVTLVNS